MQTSIENVNNAKWVMMCLDGSQFLEGEEDLGAGVDEINIVSSHLRDLEVPDALVKQALEHIIVVEAACGFLGIDPFSLNVDSVGCINGVGSGVLAAFRPEGNFIGSEVNSGIVHLRVSFAVENGQEGSAGKITELVVGVELELAGEGKQNCKAQDFDHLFFNIINNKITA